jgi:hypothetical protein
VNMRSEVLTTAKLNIGVLGHVLFRIWVSAVRRNLRLPSSAYMMESTGCSETSVQTTLRHMPEDRDHVKCSYLRANYFVR